MPVSVSKKTGAAITGAIMPRVSVVIPTYNRQHMIQRAIESVFSQTYRDIEIIVCDDGSTDNTVKVIKALINHAPLPLRLEILPQNLGVSAARNKGIIVAEGEFIAFLDSDDVWLPEKLEKQMTFLEENSSYIGVGGGVAYINKNNASQVIKYKTNPELTDDNELFKLIDECYITTSCFLVKPESVRRPIGTSGISSVNSFSQIQLR